MKQSIKHLPKCTQQELNTILRLVQEGVADCEMIIIFGSYARGTYVLYEESIQYGILSVYQSDIDILVVTSKHSSNKVEGFLRDVVTPRYQREMELTGRRYATPQFISVDIKKLNKELQRSQYFYTDLMKEGIKIYDTKNYVLDKPRELSYQEIKKYAQQEYTIFFPDGVGFLEGGHFYREKELYKIGSFTLHQACERFYNAISLVYVNYRPHTHKLVELSGKIKRFSLEISDVFPQNSDFEKRCYDLICRAYIEARYNSSFKVSKEEYEYMLERVEILKNLTERMCQERLDYYDSQIKIIAVR